MAALVFTGLVTAQGQLLARSPRGAGVRLRVAHDYGPLELGESVAVNGCCLTVTTHHPQYFDADASTETISRTNLGTLPIGSSVHLERALRVGDRFGGHIVTGHIDAGSSLLEIQHCGEALELLFELPPQLLVFIAEKGSVAVDGVSLTVNRTTETSFSVMLIPHTQQATHLGSLRRGDVVNLEIDVLARYVVHLAEVRIGATDAPGPVASAPDRDTSLRNALTRAGFL
jgi:riboflavin synthase